MLYSNKDPRKLTNKNIKLAYIAMMLWKNGSGWLVNEDNVKKSYKSYLNRSKLNIPLEFYKTFDMKYIKSDIKDIVKESNEDLFDMRGMYKIIYNHFYNLSKSITNNTKFYGAESWIYMYSKQYDKYVILIGERHQDYKECDKNSIPIWELLLNYIMNIDKFIDIYILKLTLK
jgi:hypothetical protein